MLNRLSAIIAGVSIVATTATQVIAQPVNAPKTEKETVQNIQAVIESPEPKQSNDTLANTETTLMLKEIAVQKQQEEERKKQAELDAAQKAKASAAAAGQITAQAVSYNVEQWRPLVAKYPWPVDQAMLVLSRESHGNPNAVSKTDDYGLFQIHHGLETYGPKIFDPAFNVDLAYNQYYKTRGWRPWYSVQGILW